MLVLSRKIGEEIVIGDNIRIVVMDVDRGRTRLGIKAPKDVLIVRGELFPLKDNNENDKKDENDNLKPSA